MRTKSFGLFAVLALAASACGGSSTATTGSQSPTSSTSSTATAPADQPDEVQLSYELADGDTYVYDVAIEQHIQLETEGEGSALDEEELPGAADVTVTGTGTFTFDVAAGPQPGTYEITITGDFDDFTMSGTVDGEDVKDEAAAEFAAIEPVSTSVVVDEKGRPVAADPSVDDPFGGMFGDMGGLGAEGLPGAQLGQFFGPPFGEEAVTVGDSWSLSYDTPGFGADPITTIVESEVTGTDTVNGVDVFVIDATTSVAAFEFDLGEFFIGLFFGFMPEAPSDEEQAEIDNLVENLRFVIRSDEAVSDSTTYFDAEAGITQKFEVSSAATMGFDINLPDEDTGEMAGFVMDMQINQNVTQTLVSGPTA